MSKILACLVLVLMMACGEEEKNKGETKIVDPGNIEVARVDIKVGRGFGSVSKVTVEVSFTFDSLLPRGNLMHYGWVGVIAISDVDFPEVCDASSYRDLMSYVQVKEIPPGKYYARACAANGVTGYFSKGITKEFTVEEPLYPQ